MYEIHWQFNTVSSIFVIFITRNIFEFLFEFSAKFDQSDSKTNSIISTPIKNDL